MKVLGTGLNGLVGTRITELLHDEYDLVNLSRSTGVDITNRGQVSSAITTSDASVIIHLSAKTDVDGCESDKEEDLKILGNKDIKKLSYSEIGELSGNFLGKASAWAVNVQGTYNVVDACRRTGKKIVYISTDFVFDGSKGNYVEDDQPNPLNWYGMTKLIGEELVINSGINYTVLRISFPYGRLFAKKKDFAQAIIARLQEGKPVMGITDSIFSPTYIDDIVAAFDAVMRREASGIFHVAGSQALSPYEAAIIIARNYSLSQRLIGKITQAEYFNNRAPRPYNLSLISGRIDKLGVKMHDFEEGIAEIKSKI